MLFAEADESGENEGNQNSEISQGSLTVEPHKLCSFRARVKDETLEYTDSVRNCKGKEDVCTTEIRNGSNGDEKKEKKDCKQVHCKKSSRRERAESSIG